MTRLLFLCALCVSAVNSLAEDWPQWRGPNRTGHVPANTPIPETLPVSPKILFKLPVGQGLSSPIVANGKLFHLDNQANKETLHACDATTGQPLWQATLDDVHKDSQSSPGPRCTPLADADKVYAQSCRGQLTCYSAADGKPLWQTNFVKDFGATYIGEKGQAQGAIRHGYNASPLIDGNRLIALVGGKDAAVVAFDKSTGKVLWKSQNAIPAYAPPVIATIAGRRQLLCFMVEGLLSLDPEDGKLLWQIPLKTTFGRHAATPVVVDDIVIVSSHQFGLIGVKVTKDGDALKAEKAWTNKDAATNFASPVAIGGHLYLLGPQKNLICVDPKTGDIAWSKDENFSIADAGHAHAAIIAMGPNLLVLTDGGQLVLVKADPQKYQEVSRVQVTGTTWSNPAYANGTLYLRDQRELYAVRLLP